MTAAADELEKLDGIDDEEFGAERADVDRGRVGGGGIAAEKKLHIASFGQKQAGTGWSHFPDCGLQ